MVYIIQRLVILKVRLIDKKYVMKRLFSRVVKKLFHPWLAIFDVEHAFSTRRYDLDWLRILAFISLIFYHSGMVYSLNWPFHYKSAYLTELVEYVMLIFSPWRMALIWFISGVALRYLVAKYSLRHFVVTRTVKILLPLLVGVWLVVPVQLYAQMSQEVGLKITFSDFVVQFVDLSSPIFKDYQAGIWPHVDVNHLWYLRSLWQFTLLLLVLLPFLHSRRLSRLISPVFEQSRCVLFLCLICPIWLLKFYSESEYFRYGLGFVFLLYGYMLARQSSLFQCLKHHWQSLLLIFIAGYLLILIGYVQIWKNPEAEQWQIDVLNLVYVTQGLIGVSLMVALAGRFLNHNHRFLPILNKAVFPFYILHQSVVIALAFWITPWQLGAALEALVIIGGTFAVCTALFSVIYRFDALRPLFGVSVKHQYTYAQRCWGYGIGCVIISPLALTLIF